MTKKKSVKKINKKVNIFDEGGILQGVTAAASMVPMAVSNAGITDTDAVDANIKSYEQYVPRAESFDDVLNNWGKFTPMDYVEKDQFVGKDNTAAMAAAGLSSGATIGGIAGGGAFSVPGAVIGGAIGGIAGLASGLSSRGAAKRKSAEQANLFNARIDASNKRIRSTMLDSIGNINKQNQLMQQASYYGYGGPLIDTGAVNFMINTDALNNNDSYTMSKTKMNSVLPTTKNTFENGGNLNLQIPNSGQHGGIFSNGVTIIGNGGTHEENPLNGVLMGVDEQGTPNLVEEGEVKYNNYIFSNRLEVPEEVLSTLKFKGKTFAEVAKNIQKESSERPNDPISKRGLEDSMNKLMVVQETLKQQEQKSSKAPQGNMFVEGGKAETQNRRKDITPYGYTRRRSKDYYSEDSEYLRNRDALFKDPVAYGIYETLLNDNQFGDINGNNFKRQDTEWLSVDGYEGPAHKGVLKYMENPEAFKAQNLLKPSNIFVPPFTASVLGTDVDQAPFLPSIASSIHALDIPRVATSKSWESYSGIDPLSYLRYAPAVASGISSLTDALGITNRPDYKNALLMENAGNNLRDITAPPIGNYLTYNPFDRDYYSNKLNAQAGATRSALVNQSGGNRATAAAGLLAADYNAQGQLGDLFRQAEEYNLGQRVQTEQFNRGTNQFNAQQAMQAAMANQSNDRARMQAKMQGAQMREQIDNISNAARMANLKDFIDSLGGLGREADSRAYRDALIYSDVFGTQNTAMAEGLGWTPKQWKEYQEYLANKQKPK